jgi:hypothetical protein
MYEDIIIPLGIAFAAFLFNVVLNSAFFWMASKILKLEKQDYVTPLRIVVVYTIVSFVLSAFAFIPFFLINGGFLVTMLFMVLMVLIGLGLYVYLIKKFYAVDWKNAILVFVIVFIANIIFSVILIGTVGVIMWQLGIFNLGQSDTVVTGFVKLIPLTQSVTYSGSRFVVSFNNALGTTVNITNVSVKESLSGTECSVEPLERKSVLDGYTFTVKGDCGQKNVGDAYHFVFTITYSASKGGVVSSHTESGLIWGIVES